jgi:hypothetical protein
VTPVGGVVRMARYPNMQLAQMPNMYMYMPRHVGAYQDIIRMHAMRTPAASGCELRVRVNQNANVVV